MQNKEKIKIIVSHAVQMLFVLAVMVSLIAAIAGKKLPQYYLIFVLMLLIVEILLGISMADRLSQLRKIRFLLYHQEKGVQEEPKMKEILNKRIELSTLQSQINPHFLYNTLDSIRGEALLNGQKEIANMTEKLSRFFRYCISGQETLVKLSEELQHVQDYFYIQKYRFGERIDLQIEMEEENLGEYYLPKISIQPIVENAVAHGLENSLNAGLVKIKVFRTESQLYIIVADNGKGMELQQLQKLNQQLKDKKVEVSFSGASRHTGIAIRNVNSRICLSFGEQYGLHYQSVLNTGTRAEIILPLIDDYNRETFEKQFMEIEG